MEFCWSSTYQKQISIVHRLSLNWFFLCPATGHDKYNTNARLVQFTFHRWISNTNYELNRTKRKRREKRSNILRNWIDFMKCYCRQINFIDETDERNSSCIFCMHDSHGNIQKFLQSFFFHFALYLAGAKTLAAKCINVMKIISDDLWEKIWLFSNDFIQFEFNYIDWMTSVVTFIRYHFNLRSTHFDLAKVEIKLFATAHAKITCTHP